MPLYAVPGAVPGLPSAVRLQQLLAALRAQPVLNSPNGTQLVSVWEDGTTGGVSSTAARAALAGPVAASAAADGTCPRYERYVADDGSLRFRRVC